MLFYFQALIWASSRGHNRAIAELLKANANPNIRNSDGETAADIAYSRGHDKVKLFTVIHHSCTNVTHHRKIQDKIAQVITVLKKML
jgi:ankyrin repeat protein